MFLVDPLGWTEIDGEAFAPGFYAWNSEVGRRSIGIETFWFQAVCQNHIVWDAVEVVEFSRKHTANVHEAPDGHPADHRNAGRQARRPQGRIRRIDPQGDGRPSSATTPRKRSRKSARMESREAWPRKP